MFATPSYNGVLEHGGGIYRCRRSYMGCYLPPKPHRRARIEVGRPKYSPRRQPVRLSLPIPLPIRAPNTSISSITSSASASRWVQLSWSTLRRRCSERTSLPSLSPVRIMQSTSIPPSRNPRDFKDEQKGRKGDGDGDGDGDGVGVGCAQTRRCRGEGLARRRAA